MTDESSVERRRLGATFDTAAELYEHARPDYPAELIDHLLATTQLSRNARILEIGCATGKATVAFARRRYRVTCIEPGPALARVARRNLASYDVTVIENRFEDWDPGDERFDLVFAATSWHWVDPAVRYARAARSLTPGGHLAFWSAMHVIPVDGDPFFDELQEVYDEIGEGLPPGTSSVRPGELEDHTVEIERSGLFEVVDVRHFDWERVYDAHSYIELLRTFSGHIAMTDAQQHRLYGEIRRRLALRSTGTLRRHWGAVLHIARCG